MALTPNGFDITEDDVIVEISDSMQQVPPSKTYHIGDKRLGSVIDGNEAILQAIVKRINTTMDNYLIYDDYGSGVSNLISQSLPLSILNTEIPRIISDSLLLDDRIIDATNFMLTQSGDILQVSFDVRLTNGEVMDVEVTI